MRRQVEPLFQASFDMLFSVRHDSKTVDERRARVGGNAPEDRTVRAFVPELVVDQNGLAVLGALPPDHLADVRLVVVRRDARPRFDRLIGDGAGLRLRFRANVLADRFRMKSDRERKVLQQLVELEILARVFEAGRNTGTRGGHHVLVAIAGHFRVVHPESDHEDVRCERQHTRLQQLYSLKRHAEIHHLDVAIGLCVTQTREQTARVRPVLIDVHAKCPRVADAGDADAARPLRRGVFRRPVALRAQIDVPGRISTEFLRQRRREPPQQGQTIVFGSHRREDVDIGAMSVRETAPDQCVVRDENLQPIEPGRQRAVVVAQRVRQRHEPHHRAARQEDGPQRNLAAREEDHGRDDAFRQHGQQPAARRQECSSRHRLMATSHC